MARKAPSRLSMVLASALALVLASTLPAAADETRLLRFPDIHDDVVVFVYGGDVWRAPSDGGEARRLTAHPGQELFPKISPDGRWVAYSAENSGSRQVWVTPTAGGEPRQLTFYTDVGDMPPRGGWDYWIQGWTPEGKILVRANRTPWGQRMGRYYVVDPEGGLETPLVLPEGGGASLSPDGTKIAYTPVSREFRTWKRTRGGRAQDVWLYDFEANQSTRLTDDPGTDNFPMWAGDKVYFTSDRDDVLNLFAHDLASGQATKVTGFDTWDVLWPSLGPGAIVFMNGGRLHRFDLATETSAEIPIEVRSELPHTVPHFKDVSSSIANAGLSPSGVRAVFEARGEIFTVPAQHGPTRNLSRSQGVAERFPTWSPDGRWIAYLSDESGEYEIYLRPGDGSGEPKRLTTDGNVWRFAPVWSPDSEKLAFGDRARKLWILDVDSGELTEVDKGRAGDLNVYAFSPDSRWLAYEKTYEESLLVGITLYSLESGERFALGDGLTNDYNPTWSTDGHYLFFLSDRDYNIQFSGFEFNYLYADPTRVYAAALNGDAPALFPPRSDEEEVAEEESENGDEGSEEGENGDDEVKVVVEPEGFLARTVALPEVAASNYGGLRAVEGALFYVRFDPTAGAGTLARYDLEKRAEEVVSEGVMAFELSADGSKVLAQTPAGWAIADAMAGADFSAALDLSGLRVKIDPRAEWRQMYRDGWRIARDYFYDPNMHGYDWRALGERYGELVGHVAHRDELDFIFGELIAELEAGHTYVSPGDEPEVERVEGGMLGCEFELEADSDAYRIAKIFPGENWDPDYRSPLTEPGVEVEEGQYLLAIDGEELRHPDNPYRLLEGKAATHVKLTVADDAAGAGQREVTVVPISNEGNLRYLAWVEERMALTEELSGGRVGYLHLPNTSFDGNRMLQKLFPGQTEKEALIVDDRYNGGGFIPDRMIEVLAREALSYWATRDVRGFRTPGFAHTGPKAMLINGYSSSGGDALPYYFKKEGLGPLIGTRTWGGLIGVSGAPSLVDGGVVLPPTFRFYDDGEWQVENVGVAPDIEVIDLPELRIEGRDPSLEKAVEVLLEALDRGEGKPWPDAPTPPDMTR